AAEVLKHLDTDEVQRVGIAMSNIPTVSRNEVENVLSSFQENIDTQTVAGSQDYIRKVLTTALGGDRANTISDRIQFGSNTKGLASLKLMDARGVANLVRQEHPQIIAIVLAYLDADRAAEVLSVFPESLRADVVMRIATLEGIQPAALSELDDIMSKRFAGKSVVRTSVLGGPKVAANILNYLDGSSSTGVMNEITAANEQLATSIQDMMFVFNDLMEIDDRGIQELLRGVSTDRLLLALKGADDRIKEKVFKNMSQRAAEMLRDDLAARGPVKLSDVEAAQKEIVTVARRLAEAGTINLGSTDEQYV
ncbi:MAG TPA: flagellar motor switch protein FliG, partial [Steroidobacteraceae bacterium]|nr:flagellar motor switch protein FliG [Steroidobacteraceae bacterium]